MKVIVENIDNEHFIEVVLTDFNMDIIDLGKLVTKQITVSKQIKVGDKIAFAIRKETKQEKYESEI